MLLWLHQFVNSWRIWLSKTSKKASQKWGRLTTLISKQLFQKSTHQSRKRASQIMRNGLNNTGLLNLFYFIFLKKCTFFFFIISNFIKIIIFLKLNKHEFTRQCIILHWELFEIPVWHCNIFTQFRNKLLQVICRPNAMNKLELIFKVINRNMNIYNKWTNKQTNKTKY